VRAPARRPLGAASWELGTGNWAVADMEPGRRPRHVHSVILPRYGLHFCRLHFTSRTAPEDLCLDMPRPRLPQCGLSVCMYRLQTACPPTHDADQTRPDQTDRQTDSAIHPTMHKRQTRQTGARLPIAAAGGAGALDKRGGGGNGDRTGDAHVDASSQAASTHRAPAGLLPEWDAHAAATRSPATSCNLPVACCSRHGMACTVPLQPWTDGCGFTYTGLWREVGLGRDAVWNPPGALALSSLSREPLREAKIPRPTRLDPTRSGVAGQTGTDRVQRDGTGTPGPKETFHSLCVSTKRLESDGACRACRWRRGRSAGKVTGTSQPASVWRSLWKSAALQECSPLHSPHTGTAALTQRGMWGLLARNASTPRCHVAQVAPLPQSSSAHRAARRLAQAAPGNVPGSPTPPPSHRCPFVLGPLTSWVR
jgi:hypothetical protein